MTLFLLPSQVFLHRWQVLPIFGLVAYAYLVRVLRYQRTESLRAAFTAASGKKLSDMTVEDAQAILKTLAELEFPKLYGFSMVVALFRVSR